MHKTGSLVSSVIRTRDRQGLVKGKNGGMDFSVWGRVEENLVNRPTGLLTFTKTHVLVTRYRVIVIVIPTNTISNQLIPLRCLFLPFPVEELCTA